jgi:hypothetical protein
VYITASPYPEPHTASLSSVHDRPVYQETPDVLVTLKSRSITLECIAEDLPEDMFNVKMIESIALLPDEMVRIIVRTLKDEGEHLLLACMGTIRELRHAVKRGYKGRLYLDMKSIKSISQAVGNIWEEADELQDAVSTSSTAGGVQPQEIDEPLDTLDNPRIRFGYRLRVFVADFLSMVEMVIVTDLPDSVDCADLIKTSSSLRSQPLLPSVIKVSLCPALYSDLQIWRNEHTGQHPFFSFGGTIYNPSDVCLDLRSFIPRYQELQTGCSEGIWRTSLRGLTRNKHERKPRKRPNNYSPLAQLLVNSTVTHSEKGPTSIMVHQINFGGARFHKNSHCRFFFDVNPLDETVSDSLQMIIRNLALYVCNGPTASDLLDCEMIYPISREQSAASLGSPILLLLYDQISWFWWIPDEVQDLCKRRSKELLKDGSLAITPSRDAKPCICCGGK